MLWEEPGNVEPIVCLHAKDSANPSLTETSKRGTTGMCCFGKDTDVRYNKRSFFLALLCIITQGTFCSEPSSDHLTHWDTCPHQLQLCFLGFKKLKRLLPPIPSPTLTQGQPPATHHYFPRTSCRALSVVMSSLVGSFWQKWYQGFITSADTLTGLRRQQFLLVDRRQWGHDELQEVN